MLRTRNSTFRISIAGLKRSVCFLRSWGKVFLIETGLGPSPAARHGGDAASRVSTGDIGCLPGSVRSPRTRPVIPHPPPLGKKKDRGEGACGHGFLRGGGCVFRAPRGL